MLELLRMALAVALSKSLFEGGDPVLGLAQLLLEALVRLDS